MKTLADLKRDLFIGSCLTLISRRGWTEGRNIGIKRYVVKKNTVGFYLNKDKNATKGSYLDWPKASLLEYENSTIKIYQAGKRPLTNEEKSILKNEPQDQKQDGIDALSDGSIMFYRRKKYYLDHKKFYYLFGVSKHRGRRLIHGTKATIDNDTFSDWFIVDDDVKGKIGLTYNVN